ncbi:MAG: Hsp20/alpha crystallin family protein [Treponema sp.]|nr:Hsp20/alpha crystallin family protein [Treponema sp.]
MNELRVLDSLFNDLLEGAGTTACYSATFEPRVDVKECEGAYVLEMELPGRSENDVDIELEQDKLTISSKKNAEEPKDSKESKGEKAKEDNAPKERWLLKERLTYSCNFSRSFTLPKDVDLENITANFKNGVLTITLCKKALEAPKKIMIACA